MSNAICGLLVPIPTLPSPVILATSFVLPPPLKTTSLLVLFVSKVKLPPLPCISDE